jgi:hypothetical protein
MMTVFLIAGSLIPGYLVAVGLLMAATFGITSLAPAFAVKEYRIRKRYKLVQDLVWLVCATAGGFVTAAVAGAAQVWLAGIVLAGAMILVLWTNSWEMRQRGIVHQILMSLVSAAGVATGCMLQMSAFRH